MFLMLPLKMESEYFRAGVVSAAICAGILFNTVLIQVDRWAMVAPYDALLRAIDRDPAALQAAALSLVRGAGPVTSLFLALFWLVFGHSLEQRMGSVPLLSIFLVGALLPLPFAWLGLLSMDLHYWFGLGGTMMCLGMAYCLMSLQEVRFFYFVCAPPWRFDWGSTTIAGVFPLVFLHGVFVFTQVVVRGERTPPAPDGVATTTWLLLYPFLPVVLWLATRWTMATIRRVVGGAPPAESVN